MKKLLKIITGVTLSLTMAIGVGVGVASNRNVKPVYADYSELYSATFTDVATHSYTQNKTFTLSSKGWTASVSQVNGGVFYLGCNSNNASKGVLNDNSTFSSVVTALRGEDATYNTDYATAHAYALLFENSYSDVTKVNFSWAGGNNAFQVYLFGDSGSGFSLLNSENYATSGATVSGSVEWTGNATNYSKFAIVARPGATNSTATNKTLRASTFTIYETSNGGGGDPEPTLSSVAISGSMTKTSYTTAEEWDSAGLTVTGTYSDASSSDVTASATFSYYSNEGMTSAVATPSALGVGNNQTIYVKATVSDKTASKSQSVSVSAATYSVTYNDNGATSGSVPTDATSYNNGASVTVLGNAGSLTRTGYIWSGWNTKADGTGISYSAGNTFNITSAITLYARWISDYSSTDSFIIAANYLNLTSTATNADAVLTADDGMQYITSAGTKYNGVSGNKAFDSSANAAIFIGKTGSYIYNKDAFQKNIHRIEVFANGSGAAGATIAVKFSSSICSSSYSSGAVNLNPNNKIYTFTSDINNAKFFRIESTADANAQFQLKVYFVKPTTSVTVTPESVTLAPTETQQLTTTVLPAGATDEITYSTNNPSVATVSNSGLITAVAAGSATITATSGSYSDTCEVTVENPVVAFITPTKNSTSGYSGQNETISFTYGNLSNTVVVTSDNPSVVSISNLTLIDALNGTVKFNFASGGSTTVKFKDNETVKASISVTVTQTTVSLNKNATSIYQGNSETLTATTNVGGVNWSSNNAKVTVTDGVVSVADDAVANSIATITATSTIDNSVSATCMVTVLEETRWNTGFTTTLIENIDLPVSGDTANKYYVAAKITEIANATYGNGSAIDENGTAFSVYGMYSYNGQMRYDQMPNDIRPVVGDIVVLYGVFRNNNGPQIRNARVVQRNGNIEFKPNVKLDLSTDTTASASSTLLTWSTSEFSMQIAKGDAGTATNNYYPGTQGKSYTSTRFYENSVFTFTPAQGVTVSRVSFAATSESYATAFAGSAFTNATAVAQGNVVVVTPTDGTQAFSATIGGNCGFTAVNTFYSQTIKQLFENEISTKATLSYTGYTDNGDDTFSYTNLAMRFGGYLDKDLWDILDASLDIQGYGILFANDNDLNGDTIMDVYNVARDNGNNTIDEALALLPSFDVANYSNTNTRHEPALKTTPTLVGNEYRWALYMPITFADVLDSYSAVAYIRVNNDIVFLGEISTYAAEIADQLIESGAYPENALGGSLAYLAGR